MNKIIDSIAFFFAERQFKRDLARLEEMNMTYKLMKRIITKGGYDREKLLPYLKTLMPAEAPKN